MAMEYMVPYLKVSQNASLYGKDSAYASTPVLTANGAFSRAHLAVNARNAVSRRAKVAR